MYLVHGNLKFVCITVRGTVFVCIAVFCIVLRCVAVCCGVLPCVAVRCSVLCVLQYVAVCCSGLSASQCLYLVHGNLTFWYVLRVLQCVAACCSVLQCVAVCCCVLLCVAVCCCVLLCFAVCCSVLSIVAVCSSVRIWSMGTSQYWYVLVYEFVCVLDEAGPGGVGGGVEERDTERERAHTRVCVCGGVHVQLRDRERKKESVCMRVCARTHGCPLFSTRSYSHSSSRETEVLIASSMIYSACQIHR